MIHISNNVKLFLTFDTEWELSAFLEALGDHRITRRIKPARCLLITLHYHQASLVRFAATHMNCKQLGDYINRLENANMADWPDIPLFADTASIAQAESKS